METMKYYLGTDQQGIAEVIETTERPKMISEGGKYGILSRRYNSKDELLNGEGILSEPCKECGGVIGSNYLGNTGAILKEKQLCFSCNHWDEKVRDKDHERMVIVKGVTYWRKDYRELPSNLQHVLGFSGHVFNIKMNTGEQYKTNDLWCGGKIPDRFLSRLPDNAIFL